MPKVGTLANPNEPVTAAKWNGLIRSLRRALRIRGGEGISGVWNDDGIALAIAAHSDIFILARITAVNGLAGGPDFAANYTYNVQAVKEQGVGMLNATPKRGRPVHPSKAATQRIMPAAVNDLCWIVRNKQADGSIAAELWLPEGAEMRNTKQCS